MKLILKETKPKKNPQLDTKKEPFVVAENQKKITSN